MKTRHDRGRIERLLARKDREGLTYRELSTESGIPAGTLASWRRRLRLEGEGMVFEELVLKEEDTGGVLKVVGPLGHCVAVPAEFDDETLRRVLAALPC